MGRALMWKITEKEAGLRTEQVMKSCLGLSRREISRAKFRTGGICINGNPARATAVLQLGDRLTVQMEEAAFSAGVEPEEREPLPLPEILYEDGDILVVNKPAGLLTHPVGCHQKDTLSDQVRAYLTAKGEQTAARSIGRLDKETSGAVVFAKSQMAAARLQRQREQGILYKEYLAVAGGVFSQKEGVVDVPIGKCTRTGSRERMEVSSAGKRAVTRYEVLCQGETEALLALHLETGRTHQIRVHMAWLGHALLGDTLYESREIGAKSDLHMERAVLHAGKLRLQQPFTGVPLVIEAPYPEDFARAVHHIEKTKREQKRICI